MIQSTIFFQPKIKYRIVDRETSRPSLFKNTKYLGAVETSFKERYSYHTRDFEYKK